MVRPRFLILSRYFLDPGLVNYYKTTMSKLRSLVFAAFLALPLASFAQVEFSVSSLLRLLPVYEQPACPVAGYIWTPGYWGWDADTIIIGSRASGSLRRESVCFGHRVVGLEQRRLRV